MAPKSLAFTDCGRGGVDIDMYVHTYMYTSVNVRFMIVLIIVCVEASYIRT